MTVAIVLKIADGLVLGADSASTLGNETGVVNVYFNAEKVINLYKGLPIGTVTYGLGNIDRRSTTNLAKELRERFMGSDPKWAINRASYTIEQIADQVKAFFYDEFYTKEYPQQVTDAQGTVQDVYAQMGFMVAGYSAGQRQPEGYTVEIDNKGVCIVTPVLDSSAYGAVVRGDSEAVLRLLNGWSPRVYQGMVAAGIPEKDVSQFLNGLQMEPLVQAYMPIQDGIDLVRYLIQVTEGFVRFRPREPTVHEPIDLAAITYHEGFRWVQRKHYYSSELNATFPVNVVAAPTPNSSGGS
jgi:hypothetical protein